jgi:hypothetical protein
MDFFPLVYLSFWFLPVIAIVPIVIKYPLIGPTLLSGTYFMASFVPPPPPPSPSTLLFPLFHPPNDPFPPPAWLPSQRLPRSTTHCRGEKRSASRIGFLAGQTIHGRLRFGVESEGAVPWDASTWLLGNYGGGDSGGLRTGLVDLVKDLVRNRTGLSHHHNLWLFERGWRVQSILVWSLSLTRPS